MTMDDDHGHEAMMETLEMPAGEFKAKCLRLMDQVRQTGQEIVITKRGKPVAKLVPVAERKAPPLSGSMAGTVKITGDIVGPFHEEWDFDDGE